MYSRFEDYEVSLFFVSCVWSSCRDTDLALKACLQSDLSDARATDTALYVLMVCCGRWYKTPDGKKLNAFAHGEKALGRDKAYDVIATTHRHWEELAISNPVPSDLWVRE